MADVNFIYDDGALIALERSLSADRLQPYLDLAATDRIHAIRLYEWNTKLSESLYSLIQGLEIALRNGVHGVLTEAFGQEDWYNIAKLKERQMEDLANAIRHLQENNKPIVPRNLVSELMFGFWTSLFGTDYAQSLWDRHLFKCFPTVKVKRKTITTRLRTVRFLRNRIAHHEPIIGKKGVERNLKEDVQGIITIVSWMCPVTAKWIAANSSFEERWTSRPKKLSTDERPIESVSFSRTEDTTGQGCVPV